MSHLCIYCRTLFSGDEFFFNYFLILDQFMLQLVYRKNPPKVKNSLALAKTPLIYVLPISYPEILARKVSQELNK